MKLPFLAIAIVGMAISGNGNEVHNVGDSACPLPCSDIDPGEHCDETTKKCVCGAPGSPSCIGTDKPYCYHGKCEACAHPNVYCVGKNLAGQKKCVLHDFFCDDDWDCEDGTDEKSCTHHDTTGDVGCFGDHLWECEDKKECIDATLTCDGKEDCNDGSDELMKDCADFGGHDIPRMANGTANGTDHEDHDHDDHDHEHEGSGAIRVGATFASAVAFFAVLFI